MNPVVVDENVLWVADGRDNSANSACVDAALDRLALVKAEEQLIIDSRDLILDQYAAAVDHVPPYKPAREFLLWLYENRGGERVFEVDVQPTDDDSFVEFPDDDPLANFDHDDRKWVAVAIASGLNPPIVSATDSDYVEFETALKRHVRLEILCRTSAIP